MARFYKEMEMTETLKELIAQGTDIEETLTEIEEHQLSKCEQIIAGGLGTFLNVGQALATIRDNRLYRVEYQTFEKYCKDVWDLSRMHAHRQIRAYETVNLIESKCNQLVTFSELKSAKETQNEKILPINEAQTRPLTKLKDPEDQIKAWGLVLDQLNEGKKLTAALIASAVKEVRPQAVERKFKETGENVDKTKLLSSLFRRQVKIMMKIVEDEINSGWKTTSRKEAINAFKTFIRLIQEEE